MRSRRYFPKALDRGDSRAALPLAAFKKLYDIEDEIRDRTAEEKRAVRQASSKPVHDELVAWCKAHQPHEPPSSPMGTAIRYLLNHQIALRRFLDDGRVPVDNGIVERLHVRTALTRKNFLFAGSDTGAERAAIAYHRALLLRARRGESGRVPHPPGVRCFSKRARWAWNSW